MSKKSNPNESPSPRRKPGQGGCHWDEKRQRYIATKTVGYSADGRRITRKGSGTSVREAERKLAKAVKDYEAGLVVHSDRYTVKQAVEDWLKFGLDADTDESTRTKYSILSKKHIVPNLGARRLRDLRAEEVDAWLLTLRPILATSTIQTVKSCLNRSVRRAMARGYLERNVVELCKSPRGTGGRPSKALTLDQAQDVLTVTEGDAFYPYIVVSLLTGARTEELRALKWEHVHLEGSPDSSPPIPPHIEVWRSDRAGGDTKTRLSRRTLALPAMAIEQLRRQRVRQAQRRMKAKSWPSPDLVFTTGVGTELDAANVRRTFRRALKKVPSVKHTEWTPRELRHSFVSALSEHGVPIDEIARLVGHKGGSAVTERVYRKQIRPVIQTGAQAMDEVFGTTVKDA